jgi:hypothetical protein
MHRAPMDAQRNQAWTVSLLDREFRSRRPRRLSSCQTIVPGSQMRTEPHSLDTKETGARAFHEARLTSVV